MACCLLLYFPNFYFPISTASELGQGRKLIQNQQQSRRGQVHESVCRHLLQNMKAPIQGTQDDILKFLKSNNFFLLVVYTLIP